LTRAVDDGLIRFTGISEAYAIDHDHSALRQAIQEVDFDVAMVGYNLLSPSARTLVFDQAAEHDIGVVIMCAVRGVITDASRLAAVVRNWTSVGLLDDSLDSDDPLGWIVTDPEAITAAAYKFALEPLAVGSVLTGTSSVAHLEENALAAMGPDLDPDILERLWSIFGAAQRNVGDVDTHPDFPDKFNKSRR
jgi:aryl-alcohol dehydrogenase-like predicted oxidoreductase